MPEKFINELPPFQLELSEETISHILAMRNNEKASFENIGKKLCITPEKAKREYEWFYHEQVYNFIEELQEKAETREEKDAIRNRYCSGHKSGKSIYDTIIKEQYKK